MFILFIAGFKIHTIKLDELIHMVTLLQNALG